MNGIIQKLILTCPVPSRSLNADRRSIDLAATRLQKHGYVSCYEDDTITASYGIGDRAAVAEFTRFYVIAGYVTLDRILKGKVEISPIYAPDMDEDMIYCSLHGIAYKHVLREVNK